VVARRLDALIAPGGAAPRDIPGSEVRLRAERIGRTLASWQSVGGCGAGASTGGGAGVKWVGRNVTGGLFHLECQSNYVRTDYGYNYIITTLVSADVSETWNLGLSVPWLYKYIRNPYGLGVDLANKGVGDVNALLTRKLGPINATSLTLSVGVPSGSHDVRFRNTELLPQDRQLGLGKPTASLMLDHTMDHIWGPSILGGVLSWRGGENKLGAYRAPSATGYYYVSYMMGPFATAAGLSLTGFAGRDRDRGDEQVSPLFMAAANVSFEWATDWMALLLGASFPYQYDGDKGDANGNARSPWGFAPWIVALGVAFAPF
jgi:hypothetical protein